MPNRITTEIFIDRARKIHGDFFDYSEVNYKNAYSSITVILPGSWTFPTKSRSPFTRSGMF